MGTLPLWSFTVPCTQRNILKISPALGLSLLTLDTLLGLILGMLFVLSLRPTKETVTTTTLKLGMVTKDIHL